MGRVGPRQLVIVHQIWPKREKDGESVKAKEKNDIETVKEMEDEEERH